MSKYVVRDRHTAIELTYIFNARKEIDQRPEVVAGLVALAVKEAAPEYTRDISYKGLVYGHHSLVGRFRSDTSLDHTQEWAKKVLDEVIQVYSKLEDDFVYFEQFREMTVIPPREVEA